MTAASCQLGSMNDTTLPSGIRCDQCRGQCACPPVQLAAVQPYVPVDDDDAVRRPRRGVAK